MAIIGILVVIVAVFGGYILEDGAISVLIQPAEFLIILGSALGVILISTPTSVLKQIVKSLTKVFAGGQTSKKVYFELLTLLYELFQTGKKDGVLSLEAHVEDPEKSSIFSKYPGFLKNHHAVSFLADTLKVFISGVRPEEIEALMDADMETHHEESGRPVSILTKVGDAMPGLGIVAAVLGIVITMQAIDGPPEEIGHKVAAALVGTFLGILASYGFIQPVATNIETINLSEARYLHCIKAGMMAFTKGTVPLIAVEFARRSIYSDVRPTFKEMESTLRGGK